MKIVFDYAAFTMQATGGVSRTIFNLFRELTKNKEHSVILFAGIHRNRYLKHAPKEVKQKIVGLYLPDPLFKQTLFMPLNRFLFRVFTCVYKPNICHYSYYDAPRTPKYCKNIATFYDMIHERFPDEFCKKDLHYVWKRETLLKADGVICISNNTKNDLHKFYPDLKIPTEVIYIGVSITANSSKHRMQMHPYLLYVGNRKPGYKNFNMVLKAFTEIRNVWPGNILCFGGGKFDKNENQYIENLGITGLVHQLSGDDDLLTSAYQQAFALVYPSNYEGFGLPPLEAMSLRCPVLSSNAPPMPEILGDACLYFQPQSTNELVMEFKKLLNQKFRTKLVEKGKTKASSFCWCDIAEKVLNFYNNIYE